MFIGIENHPACFAMLSEGCKRSIMAGTIFRFNTVSPLPRLRIIRSQIIAKRPFQIFPFFYLIINLRRLYIKWLFISQNQVLSFHHTQSHNTSSPVGGLKTDVYDEMSSIVPVLSRINIMEDTKCLRIFPQKEKEKILFVTKQPLYTPPPSHWTESAK